LQAEAYVSKRKSLLKEAIVTNSNTLFGHLAQRFSAHPENLATEALLYILNNTQNSKDIFTRYFSFTDDNFTPIEQFSSQVSSEGETIPDLVGTDGEGDNVFVVENKFWAELTANQPLGYLPLLPKGKSSALFFVCPEKRLITLHSELIRLIDETGDYGDREIIQETEDIIIDRLVDSQYLALVSWRRLLSDLESLLDPISERALIADLNQLQGLCEQMDSEGFIPLRSGETGNLEIPRRIMDYRNLIDDIVQQLVDTSDASTSGLASAASYYSTGRYINLRKRGEFGSLLAVDFDFWRKSGHSPIWMKFNYTEFGRGNKASELLSKTNLYIDYIEEYPKVVGTPILLTHSSDKQKVIQNCADQIRNITTILLDNKLSLS
jgi:hypothetical protein